MYVMILSSDDGVDVFLLERGGVLGGVWKYSFPSSIYKAISSHHAKKRRKGVTEVKKTDLTCFTKKVFFLSTTSTSQDFFCFFF